MNSEIVEVVNENVTNLLERATSLETGSEDQKRAYDSARELLQCLNDNYRNQQEYYYRAVQLEQDKNSKERELDIKEYQTEEEVKSKKRVSPNTAANLLMSAAGVVFAVIYESKGHMIGSTMKKFFVFPSKSKD